MRQTLLFSTGLLLAALTMASGCAQGHRGGTATGQDTLFLTWSADPATTMDVQWLTSGQLPPLAPDAQEHLPVVLPRVSDVTVDGDDADWADRGHLVAFLAGPEDEPAAPGNREALARIGWDHQGLLLHFHITDDTATEAPRDDALWEGDSVEIFIADAQGNQSYQLIYAPGVDARYGQPRLQWLDRRRDDRLPELQADIQTQPTANGYRVEARFPWNLLQTEPTTGDTLRLQFYINDRDEASGVERLVWYPAENAHADTNVYHPVAFAEGPAGSVELARGALQRSDDGRPALQVSASPDLAGKQVIARSGDHVVGRAELQPAEGRSTATFTVAPRQQGARLGALELQVDGVTLGHVSANANAWTVAPGPLRVFYRDAAGGRTHAVRTRISPFGDSWLSVQRARLRGLAPDRLYELRVEGSDDTYRFRTAPTQFDRPLVFAEGGDIGTASVVADLHRVAASWEPLFGLVGGDLAYANGEHADRWVRYLQLWHEHMRGDGDRLIPMVVTIGNHEVQGGFNGDRKKAPFYFSLFDALFSDRNYATLDFGDYLSFILLDSGHATPVQGEQTVWLEQQLAQRQHVTHLFPIYHVPIFPSHRTWEDRGRGPVSAAMMALWLPLFEQYGIKVAFEHDDHAYKRTHLLRNGEPAEEGILFIGDGAWGRSARSVHPERPWLAKALSELNVLRVELDGPRFSYQAFNEKGELLDEATVD